MNNMYENLIEEYKSLNDKLFTLKQQIRETSDGFIYITKLRCYGSIDWETHNNPFFVQELCDEFIGDNGIVDVYTNNPDHDIHTYGNVEIMTIDELKNLTMTNISMSKAITDWMSRR